MGLRAESSPSLGVCECGPGRTPLSVPQLCLSCASTASVTLMASDPGAFSGFCLASPAPGLCPSPLKGPRPSQSGSSSEPFLTPTGLTRPPSAPPAPGVWRRCRGAQYSGLLKPLVSRLFQSAERSLQPTCPFLLAQDLRLVQVPRVGGGVRRPHSTRHQCWTLRF